MCNTKKFWEEYTQKNGNEIVNEARDDETKIERLVYFYWHPKDYADVEAIEGPYKITFTVWETVLQVVRSDDNGEEENIQHIEYIPYEYIRQFFILQSP